MSDSRRPGQLAGRERLDRSPIFEERLGLALGTEPVPKDGVGGWAVLGAVELRPQLARRPGALGDDLVGGGGLEVDLAREPEVLVDQPWEFVEDALERDAHRVLDEAW